MSPTVLRHGNLRFYFLSREEPRMHVHVQCPEGEAKFWLEPGVSLAHNLGLRESQLRVALHLVEEHADELRTAWRRYFVGPRL